MDLRIGFAANGIRNPPRKIVIGNRDGTLLDLLGDSRPCGYRTSLRALSFRTWTRIDLVGGEKPSIAVTKQSDSDITIEKNK